MEDEIFYYNPESEFVTGVDYDDEDSEGEGKSTDSFEEPDEIEGNDRTEGDIELDKPGFREMQQVGFGRGKDIEGISSRVQRAIRTSEELALASASEVLKENIYNTLSEKKKNHILKNIEVIPNVHLYNIETLVLAELWIIENTNLDPAVFKKFIENKIKQTEVSPIDVFRYVRVLTKT